MADRDNKKLATEIYRTFCTAFDTRKWEHKRADRKRQLRFPVSIGGISMDFTLTVDVDRQLVRMVAILPEKVSEEKIPEVSAALCQVNCKLADGSFDLDMTDYAVAFRITAFFHNSRIGEAFVENMINFAIACIKRYRADILSAIA